MLRREFLKKAAIFGSLLSTSSLVLNKAYADTPVNHHWVFIQAKGGWDTTSMWDPKGKEYEAHLGPINKYSKEDIRKIGGISYAPVPSGVITEDYLGTFTKKHYKRMMVINGINQNTNNHKVGSRICMTGNDGGLNPTTAAMISSEFAITQPMAFIATNSYSETAGYVPVSSPVRQNRYTQLLTKDKYVGNINQSTLNSLKIKKIDDSLSSDITNKKRMTLQQLKNARLSSTDLESFIDKLPSQGSSNEFEDAEIIAAAFASGVSTCAQLGKGNFDTHADNDQAQFTIMDEYLQLVDHLWDELVRQQVDHKTTIVLVSEFSRTPGYNTKEGKDHWPITSAVFMGAGVKGNQVIGGTDGTLNARKVNPDTLDFDENGIEITAAHIHRAIRDKSMLSNGLLDLKYPLEVESIPIFT